MGEVQVDINFPRRVIKTSLIVFIIGIIYSTSLKSIWLTLSIFSGGILSLLLFLSIIWMIDKIENKSFLLKLFLIKYPAILIILYFILTWKKINVLAFLIGLGLIPLIIILKSFGLILMEIFGIKKKGRQNGEA